MPTFPWLSLSYDAGRTCLLEHTNTYADLFLPSQQDAVRTPALIAFIGHKQKSLWLNGLLKVRSTSDRDNHSQIRFSVTSRERRAASPLVYVDCELHETTARTKHLDAASRQACRRRLPWLDGIILGKTAQARRLIAQQVYARVLSPFVSIFCIFAADFGGVAGAASFFAEQASDNPGPDLPRAALPLALVVLISDPLLGGCSSEDARQQEEKKLLKLILSGIQNQKPFRTSDDAERILQAHFRGLLVHYVHTEIRTSEQIRAFETVIVSRAQEIERRRSLEQFLFEFRHVEALVGYALDALVRTEQGPLSLLAASRFANKPSSELSEHVVALLETERTIDAIYHHAVPMLAAALVLDCCPPGTHFFPPTTVFSHFYCGPCLSAIGRHSRYSTTRDDFIHQLEDEFEIQYSTVTSKPQLCTAIDSHLTKLRDVRRITNTLPRSHLTCFCCLMRKPELVLSCSHTLCVVCVRIFGQKSRSFPHKFKILECPLCGLRNQTEIFQLSPPTAGIRVLSIDGGGVRGVIPLVMLQCLEKELSCLGLPLRSHFDLACGTSSGGLITLGMFLKAWSPSTCLEHFEDLSKRVFKRRTNGSMLFLRAQELLMSYIADCRYDAKDIEYALQEAFGVDEQMFNPATSQVKVAITSTTAKDAMPCIFSNYNSRTRDRSKNYSVIRAKQAGDDATIAEVARCTSAAPWLLSSKALRSLGTFQDGGLRHNNPINIALWEQKSLWPTHMSPDFVLSLGTGTPQRSSPGSKSSPVRDRFLRRLFRSFMLSMEGESIWDDFYETLPHDSRLRYHRLNFELDSLRLTMDDVANMEILKEETTRYMDCASRLCSVRDAVYASMFYFEFDQKPAIEDELFICSGTIRVRLNLPGISRKSLYHQLSAVRAYFSIDGTDFPCIDGIADRPAPYCRPVRFTVKSLQEPISITVNNITTRPMTISGLPRKAIDIAEAQLLERPFGRADHVVGEKSLPRVPQKRKADRIAQ